MEPWAEKRLTELFQFKAENRRLDITDVTISVKTPNSLVTIKPNTPLMASFYLKNFLETDNLLFKRDELPGPGKIRLLEPIVFQCPGQFTDPDDKRQFTQTLLRLRFRDAHAASELCFDEDLSREEPDAALNRHTGPTLMEFIQVLKRAQAKWQNIDFIRTAPTSLPIKKPGQQHLRLVK